MSKQHGTFAFPVSPMRARALGEIHARPNVLVEEARLVLQFAFITDGGFAVDHAVLSELSRTRGVAPPGRDASHHQIRWGTGTLRWERHSEFSTYFWEGALPHEFDERTVDHPFGSSFHPPGSLISAVRIEIRSRDPDSDALLKHFDPTSLCHSTIRDGQAELITDFRQNADGLTRILVLDDRLSTASRSALVQRLLDIETYRTLAMMGLPIAQSLSPGLRRIEDGLTAITQEMKTRDKAKNDALLNDLSELAAELEAGAALSLYRFGATRAYSEIVEERLRSLGENSVGGYETLGSFLEKRLAPAVRTCRSIEERQANLSRKLSRAAILLRSWIDLEIEQQNTSLLASMDHRAKLQLRLQHTVEGLSVAAVSYYVVGLVAYLAKGFEEISPIIHASVLTSILVPVVIASVWMLMRSIRRGHLN
ncbi:DUF3422 family protein [Rhizobium sp. 16-449-1b]|uniref:DUF3422 family protein n=1 Tax=Rhizobium sp. 16-449-1b TaxID=2819989 RepID=UPI001AD9924D|nr:DUF3422 family protein [Rhizobium sp. 16-449-1b]MBO9197532.1 DUF3422 family protein [Rhizobium sp. 16-449-1b]